MADHDEFDPSAPEKQLRARRIPWRPLIGVAGVGALVIGWYNFDVSVFNPWWEAWWGKKERKEKNLLAAFAVPDGEWNPVPPAPIEPVTLTVTRNIHVPSMAAEMAPTAPVQAPHVPAPVFVPQPSNVIGMVTYTPATAMPLDIVDARTPGQAQGCALIPGLSEIHAEFKHPIRWDYGGQVEAMVSMPVFSPERPENELIPVGAQLVGQANIEALKRGMDMAPAPVWQYVSWVDRDTGERRTRMLPDAPSANVSGVNAIGGEVDQRWGPVIGLMALETVFNFIGNIHVQLGDSGDTVTTSIDGSSVDSIGTMVARQLLELKPIILTDAGTQILVKINKPVRMC